MYTFIIVLLILDCIILGVAVLLQSPKGGGLSATFGGAGSSPDSFIGTRQAANLLTKTTWWTAGIFMGLAYLLQLMSAHASSPRSVLDEPFSQQPAAPTAPAPTSANPAVPLTPAPAPSSNAKPTAPNPKKP
ncbi:MAG TPA: preprotein translocase subunit SecG [Vicinamibacterales bacterium]|jgi:preprotein translocase subunit SecG|nr:preprotein translocase subunit SecG [Gemmatimonadaceae bacterium]HWT45612.1 preprotein translocase subunit SecG [Vicinamibacterales bacterium]